MNRNNEILNDLLDCLSPKQLEDIKSHPYALTLIVDAELNLQEKASELFKKIIIARDQPKREIIELIRRACPNSEMIYHLLIESSTSHRKLIKETTSKKNSKSASNPRKKLPSKDELLQLKKQYLENHFREHGTAVERGWKKDARNKLMSKYGSIDNKTINRIMEF